MSIQSDFDRIALVSPEGELHNEHYHNFLLKQLPAHCDQVLEIGCGTGTFARALAARSNHVLGIDLSPEMIRLARERSTQLRKSRVRKSQGQEGGMPPLSISNIDFQVGDILEWQLPAEHFDCIAILDGRSLAVHGGHPVAQKSLRRRDVHDFVRASTAASASGRERQGQQDYPDMIAGL